MSEVRGLWPEEVQADRTDIVTQIAEKHLRMQTLSWESYNMTKTHHFNTSVRKKTGISGYSGNNLTKTGQYNFLVFSVSLSMPNVA